MPKVLVKDLKGNALDSAVELAKGTFWSGNGYFVIKNPDGSTKTFQRKPEHRYSTDPIRGLEIVEREKFSYRFDDGRSGDKENEWTVQQSKMPFDIFHGETLLIATMRCFVASVLGNEIEVPEEFLNEA